jgi:hypothetical protein
MKFLARARTKTTKKNGKKNIILKSTQNHFEMPRELCCYCTPQNSSEKILKNEMLSSTYYYI